MDNNGIIEVHDLGRRFAGRGNRGFEAVQGVNFSVRRGELFALLGTNGAGQWLRALVLSVGAVNWYLHSLEQRAGPDYGLGDGQLRKELIKLRGAFHRTAFDRIEQIVRCPKSVIAPYAATGPFTGGKSMLTWTMVLAIASATASARSATDRSKLSRMAN